MILPRGGIERDGRAPHSTCRVIWVYAVVVFVSVLFPVRVAWPKPLSSRVADYTIDVRLNPGTRSIDAHEVVVWHNTSSLSAPALCFHLYPNAFKSDNTTYMTELGGNIPARARGWIDILSLTDMRANENMTGRIQYIRPDDGNPHDSTVMMVQLPVPVAPGDSVSVSIDFHEQLPEAIYRSGWAPGTRFYLVSRWFPKLGVFQNGEWNCHQYHAFGGSFADFGVYNVKINVPSGYTLGATGIKAGESVKSDGSVTYHYIAADVHDFAWVASRNADMMTREFKYPGLPETRIILLLRPDHRIHSGRYFAAVDSAMKYFGLWYGAYPYPVLTVVDLPRTALREEMSSGNRSFVGESYPMLIAFRTSDYTIAQSFSLESVTLRELGHEYWHGIVAGSDFQNAWLDDGLDLYSTGQILAKIHGPKTGVFRIGSVYPVCLYPLATFKGLPLAAIVGKVRIREPYGRLRQYLRYARTDAASEDAYKALDYGAYRAMAYDKPDLVLSTLQGVLGRGMTRRIMKNYYEQYKFKHPTAGEFEDICDGVSGRDLGWFFRQFIDGAGTIDFAVNSVSYYEETDLGTGASCFISKVTVIRKGDVKMPVELRLSLEDGTYADTVWDGQSRWQSFTFRTAAPPVYAVLDPSGKIPIDTDFANNSLRVHSFLLPVIKWAGRILNYFQNMLLNIGTIA